ncbi:MAG: UbiA family prenyltransferase, partial [Pirellulaceae bacterium]
MTPAVSSRPARWMAYLRLFRAPNSFTAIADVAMAYLVTAPAPLPRLPGIILACATVLMYTAGMVLNDVFDYEIDREERPQRPLPAGQISVSWARWLGWEMLLVGAALAWLTGLLAGDRDASWWRPGVIGSLLAACIVLYDGGLRRTFVGPLVMGACRFWNVLMGMSLYAAPSGTTSVAGFDPSHVCIAGGIGLYIVGVTVFSRSEATQSP